MSRIMSTNNCPWSSNVDHFHATREGAQKVPPNLITSWPSCCIIQPYNDRIWRMCLGFGPETATVWFVTYIWSQRRRLKEAMRDEWLLTLIALITSKKSVKNSPSIRLDCQKRSAAWNSFDTNRGHNNAVSNICLLWLVCHNKIFEWCNWE